MKIVEVRDGFIKIESDKKLEVSSFIEIKGLEKRYIAQVIRSKNNGTGYSIYAKILFIYDGTLRKYDKTMPDRGSEISEFPFEKVNNSFNYSHPIVAGKFISGEENILLDTDGFNSLTLVSIDNPDMNNVITQNLSKQFKQTNKTVIIDMLGVLNGEKYIAGRDFKLPLNTDSLKFMYEDCLNDATADSKDLIKEIFSDLAEYSKEVKFLPFNTLKVIVDDMVEKSHIFKLLVLKNKLAKFEKAGYFASNPNDAENLQKILKEEYSVIDLSKVDNSFQNRYLEVILSELKNLSNKTYVLLEASNAISKKNIKTVLTTDSFKSTFITHSRFKYLADLKPLFRNYIVENTYANKDIFNLYSFFLDGMGTENYLIVGESTNYVPIVSVLEKYDVEIKKLPQDSVSEEVIGAEYDSKVAEIVSENSSETVGGGIFVEDDTEDEVVEDIEEDNDEDLILEGGENEESELEQEQEIEDLENETELDNLPEDSELPINDDENVEVDSVENPEEALEEKPYEYTTQVSENTVYDEEEDVEIPSELTEEFDEIENEEFEADNSNDDSESETLNESSEKAISPDEVIMPEVLPINNEPELEEFEELAVEDIEDDDILVDLTDDEVQDLNESDIEKENNEYKEIEPEISLEDIDKDIVEDVDKVFTTMKDDSISDIDLDLIDTLNESDLIEGDSELSEEEFFAESDSETLQNMEDEDEEAGFLEPLEEVSDSSENTEKEKEILETREVSTPNVPIYDAGIPDEDKVISSDDIEQGDIVLHAKYGSGVVEKMIKYGNKNLYSINFDNVGRRLLDPTLTEIKKA